MQLVIAHLPAIMEGIKKFIKQKKLDAKFKKAGEGHRLDEEKPKPTQPRPGKYGERERDKLKFGSECKVKRSINMLL